MQYKTSEYNENHHDIFKALSVKQPYAGMLATGEKTIELRSKPTSYRGQLLICSSKDKGKKSKPDAGYGCTIAFVDLYDCKPVKDLTPEEWEMTRVTPDIMEKYRSSGKGYAWLVRNPRKVIEFPVKGQLGIFNLVYTKDMIIYKPT